MLGTGFGSLGASWTMEKFCSTKGQKRNSLHFDNLLQYDNVIFGVLFTIQFPTNVFYNLTTYVP
jgi:hypothetical protein